MSEGIMKFYGYDVEKLKYKKNRCYNGQNIEIPLSPEFLIRIVFSNDNPLKFNIIIGIRIGYSDVENELPFKVEAIIRGFYEMKQEEAHMKDLIIFCIRSGSAILYPYLRSIITDITSKGKHTPIILPTLNFYKLFEDTATDELLISSDNYNDYI